MDNLSFCVCLSEAERSRLFGNQSQKNLPFGKLLILDTATAALSKTLVIQISR